MKEGRWHDVLGDCRNALNALYRGVDTWGVRNKTLSADEMAIIKDSNDKTAATRNILFSRLSNHPEKGKRLNQLRTTLFSYLSLESHGGEYHDIQFTRDEAVYALKATAGYCAMILRCLERSLEQR